jgi:hypothetical protein
MVGGCRRVDEQTSTPSTPSTAGSQAETAAAPAPAAEPATNEVSADQLLASRLPPEEASAGWIRLFDGHTLLGWDIAGDANWRVEAGSIVADQGEMSLLCTALPWQDYELILEFKATEKTNSGIFLRTPLQPLNPAVDCYEVNIAWDDHKFPTGSIVDRKRVGDGRAPQPYNTWRTMRMVLEGGQLQVFVDGELTNQYTDQKPLPTNRIGLQHNSGRIEFRNVRLRPIGFASLLDQELSQWTKHPQLPGEFTITDNGHLRVQGGRTQLESNDRYGDFVLLAEYKLPTPEMNSGVFFRCIPGAEMMGYECQVNDGMIDDNPLAPLDCGTGGIFRQQDARIVAGEVDDWNSVLLVAHGNAIAAWVNGLQVSLWYDERSPNENPRRGLRLEPGTIMIQGHDPQTDALFKQIKVTPLQ